jgi:hypothetical protein
MNQKIRLIIFKINFQLKLNNQNRMSIFNHKPIKMLNLQSRNTIIRKPKRISLMQHKIKIRNEKFYNFVTFFKFNFISNLKNGL